jgi:hypothetical protein
MFDLGFRETWIKKDNRIKGIFRSKRFVGYTSLLEKIVRCCSNIPPDESITDYEIDQVMVLAEFPDTF